MYINCVHLVFASVKRAKLDNIFMLVFLMFLLF